VNTRHAPGEGPGPRVDLDGDDGTAVPVRRLPFVVGVLADLSGHPEPPLRPLKDRRFIPIDQHSFDEILRTAAPRLALQVPNQLAEASSPVQVELTFQSLADFEPDRVARQVAPLLDERLRTRQKLSQLLTLLQTNNRLNRMLARTFQEPRAGLNETLHGFEWLLLLVSEGDRGQALQLLEALGAVLQPLPPEQQFVSADPEANFRHWVALLDGQLSAQLTAILHHPDFRRLEATWRGLYYLVAHTEKSAELALRVLNVSKKELLRDLEKAADFDQTQLFRRICEEEYGRPEGEPYGLLVGDYELGRQAADVALLRTVARVAAAAQAPFVAAAAPDLLGLRRFADWSDTFDPAAATAGAEYRSWKTFREAEEARYVALTVPRVLARAPCVDDGQRAGEFTFNEQPVGPDDENALWMSAAWAYAACVTTAYARHGWLARTCGGDHGGEVANLPARPPDEDGSAGNGPTDVLLTGDREALLSSLGFLPLACSSPGGRAVFASTVSCQKPRKYPEAAVSVAAELAARLDYLLCATLFVRRLLLRARDQLGITADPAACERQLNDWIAGYVLADPTAASEGAKARWPLAEARLEVREVQGRCLLVVRLRPRWQFEGPEGLLRLVAEVPKGPV
jgi:type VI secretion system protein ImpC